jgi:hypothetical protein
LKYFSRRTSNAEQIQISSSSRGIVDRCAPQAGIDYLAIANRSILANMAFVIRVFIVGVAIVVAPQIATGVLLLVAAVGVSVGVGELVLDLMSHR